METISLRKKTAKKTGKNGKTWGKNGKKDGKTDENGPHIMLTRGEKRRLELLTAECTQSPEK